MKILVVGGGGREHTLAWKLSLDCCRPTLFCAPGNAGTAALGTNVPIAAEDVDGLASWAKRERPDLTVVGPEVPLCAGIVDRFQDAGLRIFGPTAAAARLEGSKAFAKEVMEHAGVPTARAARFTERERACEYVRREGAPIVVKADGLAAGKGVTVCDTVEQAEAAIRAALSEGVFGDAGSAVLVEECLAGEEASILALVDGTEFLLLDSSQDHKRAYDGDRGPNTGGMGAYSPAPAVTDLMWPVIRKQIIEPTVEEMKRRGTPFRGVLYVGLMLTAGGPKVIEFNVRFGDPEAQCVLPRMKGDLIPLLEACIDGTLTGYRADWTPDPCVCIVLAAGGYPGRYRKGDVITGLTDVDDMEDVVLFHAGTALQDGNVVTRGGRVLGVSARGHDLPHAVARAYEAARLISWNDVQYRTDIAASAMASPAG